MVDSGLARSAELLQGMALSPMQQQDIVNQQIFVGHIEGIRKTEAIRMPDLTPYMAHDGRTSRDLDIHLEGPGDRVFLSDNFYQYVEHDLFPDRLSFTTQNILRMGHEDSRRQVFMGVLKARWFNTADDEARQIAVTPIVSPEQSSNNHELSLHEIAMYQYLGQLSMPTLEVLGLSLFERPKNNLGGFLVTRFVPDLDSLATLEWDKMRSKETEKYLGMALDMAATLNSELQFHGDLRFKNVCFGEAKNDIIMTDLEYGTSARDVPEDVVLLARLMSRELSGIRESVHEFIFKYLPSDERPADDVERFDYMHNHVYEPYFERLIHIGGSYLDVLTKAYDLVMRQQQAFARGDIVPQA